MDGQMYGQIDRYIDGQIDGWMDGLIDTFMDGWIDCIEKFTFLQATPEYLLVEVPNTRSFKMDAQGVTPIPIQIDRYIDRQIYNWYINIVILYL